MVKRRRTIIVLAAVFALAGCASQRGPAIGDLSVLVPVEGPNIELFTVDPAPPLENEPIAEIFGSSANWTAEPGVMQVTTRGSSSCPSVADGTRTEPDGTVTILLQRTGGPTCSLDLVQHTSTIEMPDGADNGLPITIRIGDGEGATELKVQPRAAAGQVGPVAPEGAMETVSVPDPQGPIIRPLP